MYTVFMCVCSFVWRIFISIKVLGFWSKALKYPGLGFEGT